MNRIQEYLSTCANRNEIYLNTMDLFFNNQLDEESLWKEFQQRVNPEYYDKVVEDTENVCGECKIPMLTNEPESIAVCQNCGLTNTLKGSADLLTPRFFKN